MTEECCRSCCETVVPGLRADVERLNKLIVDIGTYGNAGRYWEARWRDEAKENEQLRRERNLLREMFTSAERELAAERAARVAVASPVRQEGEP